MSPSSCFAASSDLRDRRAGTPRAKKKPEELTAARRAGGASYGETDRPGKLDDRLARGRELYNNHCYFCHGYSGDARTLAARYLDPPPRDFAALRPGELSRGEMIDTVTDGRTGTAMKAFSQTLAAEQIGAVVDYVRYAFIERKRANTRYHTAANGWPDHERYRAAYPFALGELALDTPEDRLTPSQRRGKRLFMTTCITCHDRGRLNDDRTLWEPRAVSYPRAGYSHRRADTGEGGADAVTGATPYADHDTPPTLADLSAVERRGEAIYQQNCAFCHAADGTGRNWIGSFLQPRPRDLTDGETMSGMTSARLRAAIADGRPGSAMPAWRTVLDSDQIDAVAAYVRRAFMDRE